MMSQEGLNTSAGRPATLGANFNSDEVARLVDLRRTVHEHTEYLERVIDQRRLEFARWLLDHGKLSEAMPAR